MIPERNENAIEFKNRFDALAHEYDAVISAEKGEIVARIPGCPEVVLNKPETSGLADESTERVSKSARYNPFHAILGLIFVLMCPIICGGLLLILPNLWFGLSSGWCAFIFAVYSIVWYVIWDGPLERGNKIPSRCA